MPGLAFACAGGDCETEAPLLVAAPRSGELCLGLYGEGVPFLNSYNDTPPCQSRAAAAGPEAAAALAPSAGGAAQPAAGRQAGTE